VLGDFVDASGNRLPLAPKWTISASAQYVRPLPFRDLEGLIRAEYSFVDDFEGDSSNNSLVFVQSRDLWNFRLGVRSGRATLVGYVENALDEVYYTGVGTPALSFSGTPIAVGRPRTFGVRLSYAWD
jgi:iron complex outermembrane receptor protein